MSIKNWSRMLMRCGDDGRSGFERIFGLDLLDMGWIIILYLMRYDNCPGFGLLLSSPHALLFGILSDSFAVSL